MTAAAPRGLSDIATPDLERLGATLTRSMEGPTLTRATLAAARLGHLWEAVCALGVLDRGALKAVVGAVLTERSARPATRVDLVWTGLEGKQAYARPTGAVVRDMFEAAQSHVMIAGYCFDHGREILEPLHAAMVRGPVSVDMYLHIERALRQKDVTHHVRNEIASFFAENWPFGTPHPAIYFAPRTIDPRLCESLHAKCIVVDGAVTLVGSANFTDRGQTRNIEVGAMIQDAGFAGAVLAQFHAATNAGVFERFETSG